MKQFSDAAMTVGKRSGSPPRRSRTRRSNSPRPASVVKEQLGGALPGALALAAAGQIDVAQATEIATDRDDAVRAQGRGRPPRRGPPRRGRGQGPRLRRRPRHGAEATVASAPQHGPVRRRHRRAAVRVRERGHHRRRGGHADAVDVHPAAAPSRRRRKSSTSTGSRSTTRRGSSSASPKPRRGVARQARRVDAGATERGPRDDLRHPRDHAARPSSTRRARRDRSGWIKKVNDTGFASAQAAGKMNSLQGDVQKLAAAFQTDLIKAGRAVRDR
jgi:hypothetical protein